MAGVIRERDDLSCKTSLAMPQKTVVVTVFHSFISKNILQTDVFRYMETAEDTSWVLLVPKEKEGFFSERFTRPNVKVVGLDIAKEIQRPRNALISAIAKLFVDSFYVRYKRYEKYVAGHRTSPYAWIRFYGILPLIKLLSSCSFLWRSFRVFACRLSDVEKLEKVLRDLKLTAVFSTDLFDEGDALVQFAARKQGLPLLGMVRSWDNCWSKGLLRTVPDRIIVNNREIERELVQLHGVPVSCIQIGGIPQYDRFFRREGIVSRETFMRSIGADPADVLVVFAPAGTILSDGDADICEKLDRAIEIGGLQKNTRVLVRNHPHHPAKIEGVSERFIIEHPGAFRSKNLKATELDQADLDHLTNTLAHANALIYVATTLGIDSLPFDTPQIVVSFDRLPERPLFESVRRYYLEDHMKKMLDLGGVAIARSSNELVELLAIALQNPKNQAEGRAKIMKQQIYFTDGKSGKRVAGLIRDWLSSIPLPSSKTASSLR